MMKLFKKQKRTHTSYLIPPTFTNGYTLLFAVFTATLVLGVAVFILSVSKRQFELSIAARDSMYSFYAADSGLECAASAYAAGEFGTTTLADPVDIQSTFPNKASIFCNSTGELYSDTFFEDVPISDLPTGWHVQKVSSPIFLRLNDQTCARVVVYNGYDADWNNVVTIESRGYNYCYGAVEADSLGVPRFSPKPSSRTVERGLRLIYR